MLYDDDDDLEGDLGYAAAEGMEGNQRKVIVERLERSRVKIRCSPGARFVWSCLGYTCGTGFGCTVVWADK